MLCTTAERVGQRWLALDHVTDDGRAGDSLVARLSWLTVDWVKIWVHAVYMIFQAGGSLRLVILYSIWWRAKIAARSECMRCENGLS
jgi:hypothetical protein